MSIIAQHVFVHVNERLFRYHDFDYIQFKYSKQYRGRHTNETLCIHNAYTAVYARPRNNIMCFFLYNNGITRIRESVPARHNNPQTGHGILGIVRQTRRTPPTPSTTTSGNYFSRHK